MPFQTTDLGNPTFTEIIFKLLLSEASRKLVVVQEFPYSSNLATAT
jgi:hypothetical protein